MGGACRTYGQKCLREFYGGKKKESEGNRTLTRSRRGWYNNVEIYLTGI